MKRDMLLMALCAALSFAAFIPPAIIHAEGAATTKTASKITKEGDRMAFAFIDETYKSEKGTGVIYLAGGCFWGLEKLMQTIPGAVRAVSGYANGDPSIKPTYREVCGGRTGYRETVRVEYREDKVSLDAILFAFFGAIDPTVKNRQGNDIGSQYQSGIYFADENSAKIVEHVVKVEKMRHKNFAVEIKPLESFYDAEEYHQNYLDKNPGGYCHITPAEMKMVEDMIVDPAKYRRPEDEEIRKRLSKEAYMVAVESGTEPSFNNEFWDHKEKGIYVDVITGEPLFSSKDKFESPCGWPAFSKPIDPNTIVYLNDNSFGMRRTEVRSRAGNSHLGHVFNGDPHSPNGTRFCINSLSLRFIPFKEMDKAGYGYLTSYVE
ncbi:MAG: peptide-methionine (R)-S-oxide reductase MsrB [Synergistaceae bacterium]